MLSSEPLSAATLAFPGLNHAALEDTVLATIINAKVADIAKIKAQAAKLVAADQPHTKATLGFKESLSQPGRRFILECKRASPTLGDINLNLDIPTQVELYSSRAAAISVLTEEHFFKGSYEVLRQARELTTLPILFKDFVICKEQIQIAQAIGANAVLLMLSVLTEERFTELYAYAKSLGLDALVEVSTADEAQFAATQNLDVVGINNRDLKTLTIDLNRTLKLAPYFAQCPNTVLVSESGIKDHYTIEALAPIKCFLIGSALCAPQQTPALAKSTANQDKPQASAQDKTAASAQNKPQASAQYKTKASAQAPTLAQLKQDIALNIDAVLYGLNKICGNNTQEGIEAAIRNHVALSGLIFAPKSPRYISPAEALKLIAPYQGKIAFCGVFVNEPLESVVQIARDLNLSFVQLHGSEDVSYLQSLKAQAPQLKLIKAFTLSYEKVANPEFLQYMKACAEVADYLLIDSSRPGSGTCVDFKLIPDNLPRSRTLLAGGLSHLNLKQVQQQALSYAQAHRQSLDFFAGFDLNSKLETAPGIKQPAFVDAAFSLNH